MTEPLNNDFVITHVVVDQVGIGRQKHAPNARNGRLPADEILQLNQGYPSRQTGLDLGRPF